MAEQQDICLLTPGDLVDTGLGMFIALTVFMTTDYEDHITCTTVEVDENVGGSRTWSKVNFQYYMNKHEIEVWKP